MIWRIARRRHNIVFVFGKQAKVLREMLDSAVVPDRTAHFQSRSGTTTSMNYPSAMCHSVIRAQKMIF